jgi:hypothetical protein
MAEPQAIKQPTVENADDAYLEAKSRFDQWLQEFQVNWYKPQVQTAAKLMWMTQPEPIKSYVRQSSPDAAKKMDDLISGKGR